MAKVPSGVSLLFGALADSGRIKQRKNGSYRMILKGLDEIDWFTDRPYREEGTWKPKKLIRKWDSLFETGWGSEPNAQCSFKVGDERDLITFEMFKPKWSNKKKQMIFKIDAQVINDREADALTGLKGKQLNDISLFIDDAISGDLTVEGGQTWKGNVIGNVIGDVTGNVVGDVVGSVKANPQASKTEVTVQGNVTGHVIGDVQGDVTGRVVKSLGEATCSLNSAFGQGQVDLANSLMIRVNLPGVDMEGANLEFVNFTGSDLSGANLTNANLAFANLRDIKFKGAIFSDAIFWNTTCPDGTNSNDPGNSTCGF